MYVEGKKANRIPWVSQYQQESQETKNTNILTTARHLAFPLSIKSCSLR